MTTANDPLAAVRDMFAAHTLFRRKFGVMPGLVRAVAVGDKQRSALREGSRPARVPAYYQGRPARLWLTAFGRSGPHPHPVADARRHRLRG